MGILGSLIKLFGGSANAQLLRTRRLVFVQTGRGRIELETNQAGLDARLRALLKLADGLRSGDDLLHATEAMGVDEVSLLKLYAWGYIESTSEDENQRLEHLIATMDGLQRPSPAPAQYEDSGKTVSFKVLDAKRMAEEAERLDFSVQRRKKARVLQQRKQTATEGINAFGTQMLADLHAKGITIDQLESEYPHLVNRLALAFGQPAEFIFMLDGLILDDRGGREGFSLSVMRDLDNLKMQFLERFVPPEERSELLGAKPRLR